VGYKGCDHQYTIKILIFEHLYITISWKTVFTTKAFVLNNRKTCLMLNLALMPAVTEPTNL